MAYFDEEVAWKLSFQFPSGVTNFEAIDMQQPETEMMYIYRALFEKSCEITSSKYIFGAQNKNEKWPTLTKR